jgi:NADH:ubiquinone oxidoreductase subunit K
MSPPAGIFTLLMVFNAAALTVGHLNIIVVLYREKEHLEKITHLVSPKHAFLFQ